MCLSFHTFVTIRYPKVGIGWSYLVIELAKTPLYSEGENPRKKRKGVITMTKRNKTVRGNTIHVKTKLIDTFIKMKIGGFTDQELEAIGRKISEIVAQNDPR